MATERLQTEPLAAPPIDLAQERPFRLGDLFVSPALREIAAADGIRQTLEPRVMQVLVALRRAEGAIVSRDELILTCWNGVVVGEGAINRVISLLRRVSEGIGNKAFRIETISKVGYRLVLSAYDPQRAALGTDGARQGREIVHRNRIAWAALAIAITLGAAAAILLRPAHDGPAYSIHVEPFRISGEAASFNEELLSTLTSQNVPLAAGQEPLTLTGSVEERDRAIRVNARLIDPDDGEVVWSGALDRAPTERSGPAAVADAAAIVGQIAQCILAGANDGDGNVPIDLLSGYARTCELGYRGQSPQGLRAARELTRRAPDFAPGWFALSFHALTVYLRQPGEDPTLRAEALAASEKLIELRPNAQDGYASKFAAMAPKPTVERERLLLRATRLEPLYVDLAQGYLGQFLWQAGRLEEAFQVRLQLAQQRPDDPFLQSELFYAAAATGRWRIADQALERVRQLDRAPPPPLLWRKAVWREDWAEARQWMPVESPAQEEAAAAAYRALASGNTAHKEVAVRLIKALPADCCIRLRVELLGQLGQPSEAIAILDRYERARTVPTRQGLNFLWDPALRPLWYDAAFTQFLRRNGWVDYWNEAKVAPDVCRQQRRPPFCGLLKA